MSVIRYDMSQLLKASECHFLQFPSEERKISVDAFWECMPGKEDDINHHNAKVFGYLL